MKRMCKVILFFIFLSTGCIHEPVDSDYYLDIDKIKGKNPPTAPVIQTPVSFCESIITLTFDKSTDPDGDDLVYLLYASVDDPAFFDSADFYKDEYLSLQISDDGNDPQTNIVYSYYSGTLYLWMTAYDGGRESDHSNYVSLDLPGGSCP